MSSETEQRTLNGSEARCGRTRPRTMLYCQRCGEWLFRRERFGHKHHIGVASWQQAARFEGGSK